MALWVIKIPISYIPLFSQISSFQREECMSTTVKKYNSRKDWFQDEVYSYYYASNPASGIIEPENYIWYVCLSVCLFVTTLTMYPSYCIP